MHHLHRLCRPPWPGSGAKLASTSAVLLLLLAPAGWAQECVGDCNGDERVTIDELVRGVSISLGSMAGERCPSFDANRDGTVAINELTRSVADSLYGCGVTPPTPRPTSTRTPTPPPTPTGTESVGQANVSGTWREDEYRVASSTCPDLIVDAIRAAIASEPTCDYQVSQSGSRVTAVDCDGVTEVGEIDPAGILRFDIPPLQETDEGCTVTLSGDTTIDVTQNPVIAVYALDTSFTGACPLRPCTTTVTSRWTRQ